MFRMFSLHGVIRNKCIRISVFKKLLFQWYLYSSRLLLGKRVDSWMVHCQWSVINSSGNYIIKSCHRTIFHGSASNNKLIDLKWTNGFIHFILKSIDFDLNYFFFFKLGRNLKTIIIILPIMQCLRCKAMYIFFSSLRARALKKGKKKKREARLLALKCIPWNNHYKTGLDK